jgi:hypothetical protein
MGQVHILESVVNNDMPLINMSMHYVLCFYLEISNTCSSINLVLYISYILLEISNVIIRCMLMYSAQDIGFQCFGSCSLILDFTLTKVVSVVTYPHGKSLSHNVFFGHSIFILTDLEPPF